MTPTVGRIVHVILTAGMAETINKMSSDSPRMAKEFDILPAIVVGLAPLVPFSPPIVNVQVFANQNAARTEWFEALPQGDGPGCWFWPPMSSSANTSSAR